jgi:hypothetical protein
MYVQSVAENAEFDYVVVGGASDLILETAR